MLLFKLVIVPEQFIKNLTNVMQMFALVYVHVTGNRGNSMSSDRKIDTVDKLMVMAITVI